MGRVIEKVKLINVFDPERSVVVDALVDTGATMISLPQNIVEELGLRKMREASVRYGNNKREVKPVYGVVTAEIKGRAGNFDVVAEPEGSQPLIGQVVLPILDLLVDTSAECVIPNPRSPDMPMVEVMAAALEA